MSIAIETLGSSYKTCLGNRVQIPSETCHVWLTEEPQPTCPSDEKDNRQTGIIKTDLKYYQSALKYPADEFGSSSRVYSRLNHLFDHPEFAAHHEALV